MEAYVACGSCVFTDAVDICVGEDSLLLRGFKDSVDISSHDLRLVFPVTAANGFFSSVFEGLATGKLIPVSKVLRDL